MSDQPFWHSPPWQGGKGGFRLALAPVDRVFDVPATRDDIARKQHLIQHQPAAVVATGGDPDGAAQSALCRFMQSQRLPVGVAQTPIKDGAGIAELALAVPDDLCLMGSGGDGQWRLVAACVCAPSYWRLDSKAGRTLPAIHSSVQGVNETIGSAIDRFFLGLPTERAFSRRNWFLHRSRELYQPDREDWSSFDGNFASLTVRSERQALYRLADQLVLFTIRVTCHPLEEIRDHPSAAADMRLAVGSLAGAELRAFGMPGYVAELQEWLREIG